MTEKFVLGAGIMSKFRLLLFAFFFLRIDPASAQVVINGIPLYADVDLDIKLKATGNLVTLSAKLQANLNNIRATFNSFIPTLNKKFACKFGPLFGATFSNIAPDIELLPTSKLQISATVHVIDCFTNAPLRFFGSQLGAPWGDVRITLPVTAVAKIFSIKLQPDTPRISSTGIIWVANEVSKDFAEWLSTKVTVELHKEIALLEVAISKALLNPAVQKQIRIFQPKIDLIQFYPHGFDLSINLQISGQATSAAVSKWLNQN